MRELLLRFETDGGRRAGIETALREAIREGQLPAGTLLPSTRLLATELGLARATVVAAYEQLAVEGYLVARQGSGTTVAALRVPEPAADRREVGTPAPPAADFRPGEPDPGLFPRSAWARSTRRVLTEADQQAFGYGDQRGMPELRTTLAEYLGRTRAVFTGPAGISVFGGVTSSFGFLGEAFRALGITSVAVENPSLFLLRDVLKLVGLSVVPVPVDDNGLDVDALRKLDVGAVVVTPGHQFPLGVTMSPQRRSDLIEWARQREAWIVEDDYDGEFRYDRRPIGALQGLDPERVIYAGTASKTLSPALRLSWLVVPRGFRDHLARVKHLRGGVSAIEQLALADFIKRGDLDRHLRSARTTYLRRQERLTEVLANDAPWLTISPAKAGLHLAATLTNAPINEPELVARAEQDDVALLGLGALWIGPPAHQGLVIGYSRPAEHQFPQALDQLRDVLRSIGRQRT